MQYTFQFSGKSFLKVAYYVCEIDKIYISDYLFYKGVFI